MIAMRRRRAVWSAVVCVAEMTVWLVILGLIVFGLLSLAVAGEPAPAARVAVYHAWLRAVSGPTLPDSLANRPRKNPSLRHDEPAGQTTPEHLTEEEVEQRLAECREVGHVQAWLRMLPRYSLLVFGGKNCIHCERFKRDSLPELVRLGYNVQMLDVDRLADVSPVVLEYFDIEGIPAIIALDGGDEIGRIEGYATPAQASRLFDPVRRRGPPRSAAPTKQKTRASTSCLHLRGRWTWPGGTIESLRRHLCGPPHNFPPSRVAEMSPGQLIAAHDAWHDRHGPGYVVMRGHNRRS
jgi:hypothetical protein